MNPFQPAHLIAGARQGLGALEPGKTYERVRCVVREARTDTFRSGKFDTGFLDAFQFVPED